MLCGVCLVCAMPHSVSAGPRPAPKARITHKNDAGHKERRLRRLRCRGIASCVLGSRM
jgi:hypothetical protein